MEFLFKASPTILYQFLTTPSCLIRWFCDKVDIQEDTYTFVWSGSSESAQLIDDYEDELLRFQWEEAESPDEFLEFLISEAPITGETILIINDYCDADEIVDQKRLWESQMGELRKAMGGG